MSDDPIVAAVEGAEEAPAPASDLDLAFERRNDLGNSRRLIARHGDDLIFVEAVGWAAWDGCRFSFHQGRRFADLKSQDTADLIFDEADALPKFTDPEPDRDEAPDAWAAWDERRQKHESQKRGLRQWATASGNKGKLNAMIETAAPSLARDQSELDRKPLLLNCANGTLDLSGGAGKSLQLMPARRSDLLTRVCNCDYDPAAIAPKWQQFVDEILPLPDVREFVQRWLGYCITGEASEQVIVYFEGAGANGKSTLLEMVSDVIGDYEVTVPIETFLHQDRKGGADASPDLARLPGARLVRASEPEVGARLSESRIKQITGGENMTARRLYKEFFDFDPTFKLTLSVNIRPIIRGKDHGIRRRILVVPFTQLFDSAKTRRGEKFADRFADEMPGILNWLLDGFEMWFERGLDVPADVSLATEQYFAQQDPIGQFLAEATDRIEGERVKSGDLYRAYQAWCRDYGEETKSQGIFGRRLSDMKLRKEKIGTVYYFDIRLKDEYKTAEPAGDHPGEPIGPGEPGDMA